MTEKPIPFVFLEASVWIWVYSGNCWCIISKNWFQIIKLSVFCLQYSVNLVLMIDDQSQGGWDGWILFSVCAWKDRFSFIILKFSNSVLLEGNRLGGRGLWKICMEMWSDRFLILGTYFKIWFWSILSTGLVRKAPMAKRMRLHTRIVYGFYGT